MAITPLSGSEATQSDEVWGDFGGGTLVIGIQHPSYFSTHIVRVLPFDAGGGGGYSASPAGSETTVQQTADNIVTLIRALYAADTSVAVVGINRTASDHTGENPYDFDFATTHFGAGTAGGASLPVPNVLVLSSRGPDGSRWRLTLPGCSNAVSTGNATRGRWSASPPGPGTDLQKYIGGQTDGPVSALKTAIVTHNGVGVSFTAGNTITGINRRLQRHFKLD
jgi:hypothetical protein